MLWLSEHWTGEVLTVCVGVFISCFCTRKMRRFFPPCLSLIKWSPELFLALLYQTLHIPQRHFTFLMKLKTYKKSTVSFTVCRSQLLCSLIRSCGAFESSLFFPLLFPFPSLSCFLMWKIFFFVFCGKLPFLSQKLLFFGNVVQSCKKLSL